MELSTNQHCYQNNLPKVKATLLCQVKTLLNYVAQKHSPHVFTACEMILHLNYYAHTNNTYQAIC